MDPEVIAKETGISLEEAKKLAEWSQTPEHYPEPAPNSPPSDEVPDIAFLQSCFPDIPAAVVRIKYNESQNLEQASDLLLNWSVTRNESNQFLDKRLQRQAKQKHKFEKKHSKSKAKQEHEIELLTQVIDELTLDDARVLYAQNDSQFDKAVSAHFKAAAPHVHAMIAGMEKIHIGGISKQQPAPERSALEFEAAQQRLDAELATLEGYRRTKGVPGILISESLGRIANLRSITAESCVVDAMSSHAGRANTIDFHNMTVKAAVAVCEYRVKEWKDQTSPELYLITGAGRHSYKGVPVVKNAIRDVVKRLNDYRYFVREDEGAFLLTRTMR